MLFAADFRPRASPVLTAETLHLRGPYGGPPTVDGGSTRRHIMRFMKGLPAFFVLLEPPRLYPTIMPALLKRDWNFRTVRDLKMQALACGGHFE